MRFKFIGLTIFFVLTFGILATAMVAQSSDPTPIYSIDWNDNVTKIAIVTRLGLTIYDGSFNQVAFQSFPSDVAFQMPNVDLSPDGERIYIGRRSLNPKIVGTNSLQQYCDSNWTALICANHAILETNTLQLVVDLSTISVQTNTAQWDQNSTSILFRNEDTFGGSLYNATDGLLLRTYASSLWRIGPETGPIWSPNNRYLVTSLQDEIILMDGITGNELKRYQLTGEIIGNMAFSPDSSYLAIGSSVQVPLGSSNSYPDEGSNFSMRDTLFIMEVSTGNIFQSFRGIREGLGTLTWSRDEHLLVGINNFESLYIFDVNAGTLSNRYALPFYAKELFFSPYGGRLTIVNDLEAMSPSRVDEFFMPSSVFMEAKLNGAIWSVAPNASPEQLQTILARCVTDTNLIEAGYAFINAGQYAEFKLWVNQQNTIPMVCADDLRLVSDTILSELPPVTATNTPVPPTNRP